MKKLLCMLLVMVLAVCTFAACDLINPKAHEHEYSAEWASDAENHWHAATCDAEEACATAIADQAAHSDEDEDNKCDVCAYVLHTHTFTEGKCECGAEDPNYVAPHTHNYVNGKCECGETDPNYVPPHTHTFVEGKCECGESDPNYVPPHTHNYVNGKCECGEYDPAHTHDYGEGVCICGDHNPDHTVEEEFTWHFAMVTATCTTPGARVFVCTDYTCDYYYTVETDIDPDAHESLDYANAVVIMDADCATETDGLQEVTCLDCGVTVEEPIYAFHDLVEDVTFATCTVDGHYHAECSVCDYEEDYDITAEGHYNWFIGCGQTGTCMECEEEFTKPDHELTEATCASAPMCVNCWEIIGEALPHDIENGICTVCGGPDLNYGESITHPEVPTIEYFEGVWYGEEYGSYEADPEYEGKHTFVITFDADGKGTGIHSLRGEFVTYGSVQIKEDHIEIYTSFGTLYLVYDSETGILSLRGQESFDYGLTKGTEYFKMFKVAGVETDDDDNGDDDGDDVIEAPANLTAEYFVGTWTGSETAASWSSDYAGDHTFTVIINEGAQSGTVIHSCLGEFAITNITFMSTNVVMMELDSPATFMLSIEYNNGVFTLAEGKNFTYGSEFTMTKSASAGEPDDGEPTPEPAPENLTSEYFVGTWYGAETGATWSSSYAGDHTFTVIINEGAQSGTVIHSCLGEFAITNITFMSTNVVMMELDSPATFMLSIEYNNGVFTLAEGKNFTYGTDNFSMSKTPIADGGDEDEHVHEFVNGECECGEADPDYVPETPAFPENLTEEYLVGTWNGTEVGGYWYSGEYTFTITFNADGSATMTHSEFGDVEIYDYYVEGNTLMIMCSAENSSVAFEYANGAFTILEGSKGFTYGTEGSMTKAVEEEEEKEPAPEVLTYEYLTGTWTGTEIAWGGAEHTFTIEFDGQMGTVTHSELGTFDVIVEISYGMIYAYPDCEYDMTMWVYADGTITLFDSMKNFTGGSVLTMTKA